MLSTAGAFLATAAGKAVAGTAIAAASVGGLAATDVIELPSNAELPAEVETNGPETNDADSNRSDDARTNGLDNAPTDLPDGAVAGQAFAADMQAWADCVATNAAAQGDDDTRTATEGEFDPTTGPTDDCGPRPVPPTGEGTGLEGADNAQNADDRQPDAADVSGERGAEARESAPAPADDAGTQADDAPAAQADAGAGNAPADAGAGARP